MAEEFVGWLVRGANGSDYEIWVPAGSEAEAVWTQRYGSPRFRGPKLPYYQVIFQQDLKGLKMPASSP